MFSRSFIILLVALFLIKCSERKNGELKLRINDEYIRINHEIGRIDEPCVTTCADINFSLINETSTNYVLYNFRNMFHYSARADSLYCEGGSSEKFVIIYDSKLKQVFSLSSILPGSIEEPKTNDELRDFVKNIKDGYMKQKQVVESEAVLNFNQEINLRNFELAPGEYYLKVLYFQHNISRYVTMEERQAIEKEFEAEAYKGCLWSNPVKLIVD